MAPRPPVLLALAGIATSLALTGWVLWLCGHGLDFTDEGLYLNWIATPFGYDTSISQFGFVYHPLFQWAGGGVAAVRRLNMLLTLGLGWGLAYALLRVAAQGTVAAGWGRRIDAVVALVAATSVFSVLGTWLPTPNYNTLALQSLLLAGTGFVLTRSGSGRAAMAGFVLLGLGGALAFLAKPTTAALLAALGLVPVLWPTALRWRGPLVCIVAAVLVLAGVFFAIDGQLPVTVQRYKGGLALAQLLTPSYDAGGVVRWEPLVWSELDRWWAMALAGATAVALVLAAWPQERVGRIGALAAAGFAVVTVGALLRELPADWYGHAHRGLWVWTLLGAAALAAAFHAVRTRDWRPAGAGAAIGAWLALLPSAFAFGTNNSLWSVAALASCFWAFAAIGLLAPLAMRLDARRPLFVLAFGAQAMAAVVAAMSAQVPYRQRTPLPDQTASVQVHGNATLVVEDGAARYIRDLTGAARAGGFRAGTALIDLTGRTPTATYVVGASAPGQAWLLGGYPGSDSYAKAVLRTVPCAELARAWVLLDTAPGAIHPDVLLDFGASLGDDYTLAGKFAGPILFEPGAAKTAEAGLHRLYAPNRSTQAASEACERSRAGRGT